MAKRPPKSRARTPADSASVKVPQQRELIEATVDTILGAMESHGYSETSRFAVRLALEETISNAFRHGHAKLPEHTPIRVDYRVDDDEVEFTIEDQGPGFNPKSVPDPTLDENLELPGGRGLVLMRAYMTEVQYLGKGNRVRMVYRRPPARRQA